MTNARTRILVCPAEVWRQPWHAYLLTSVWGYAHSPSDPSPRGPGLPSWGKQRGAVLITGNTMRFKSYGGKPRRTVSDDLPNWSVDSVLWGPGLPCLVTEHGLWDLADLSDQTVCVASWPNTESAVYIITQVVFICLFVIYLSLIWRTKRLTDTDSTTAAEWTLTTTCCCTCAVTGVVMVVCGFEMALSTVDIELVSWHAGDLCNWEKE